MIQGHQKQHMSYLQSAPDNDDVQDIPLMPIDTIENVEFVGIDIGHGESAAAYARSISADQPKILEINGYRTITSVVAVHPQLGVLIGDDAINISGAISFARRFKSMHLERPDVRVPMEQFIGAISRALRENALIGQAPRTRFIVGCPSAWPIEARQLYAALLQRAGLSERSSDIEIMSESRAAFIASKEAGELHVSENLLVDAVLIVDMGSSTIDFTAVSQLQERPIDFGNNELGAGLIDKAILDYVVAHHDQPDEVRRIFALDSFHEGVCELACRKAKEAFFSREDKYKVQAAVGGNHKLKTGLYFEAQVNAADMRAILSTPLPTLGNRNWPQALRDSLEVAKARLSHELGKPPTLVILTGGASRMGFALETCRQVFEGASVVRGKEPEFAIATGLALAGRIDMRVQAFEREVAALIASGQVQDVVADEIGALIDGIVQVITDELPGRFMTPVFESWKRGEIETIRGVSAEVGRRLGAWLQQGEASPLLAGVLSKWFRELSPKIEEMTEPLCDKYDIPSSSFRLDSIAFGSEQVTIGNPFGDIYDEVAAVLAVILSTIIATVVTVVSAAIAGPIGWVIVAAISLVASGALANFAKDMLFDANVPGMARRFISTNEVRNQVMNKRNDIRNDLTASFTALQRQMLVDSAVAAVKLELQSDAERVALQIR